MAQKIVDLLDDPARRQRMGTIGRERVVSELSWDYQIDPLAHATDRLISAYKRALGI